MTAVRAFVLATGNDGKRREIEAILARPELRFETLAAHPGARLPPEGDAYRGNALAKARAAAAQTGLPALGDDSGLEVDALGGAPGPHSARYGGEALDDAGRWRALLTALADVPPERRAARFVCHAAVALPDGRTASAVGTCEGVILREPRGKGGFGYDPIFGVDDGRRSLAELGADEKNARSHRAHAFRALWPAVEALLAAGAA